MRTYILSTVVIVLGACITLYFIHQKTSVPHFVSSAQTQSISTGTSTVATTRARGTLTLTYRDSQLAPIDSVTQEVAQSLCGIVSGDGCRWNGQLLVERPFYLYGTSRKQPRIEVIQPQAKQDIQSGASFPIQFKDPGPAGRYRVFLLHQNILGEIDEVHEAHITSRADGKLTTLGWDGNEVFVSRSGVVEIKKLPKGHYNLTIANIETGVEGGPAAYIQTLETETDIDRTSGSFIKSYAANTPLVNSYWDGRGVLYDGKGGEDTVDITSKRADVVVFRGVDMSWLHQYQTLVFYRRTDSVVIVTTNVEIIKFQDQTITATELITELMH